MKINSLLVTYVTMGTLVFAGFSTMTVAADRQNLNAAKIGEIVGVKPSIAPDGVVKLSWARDDVPFTVDGVPLKPFAGLGSWAAFTSAGDDVMMMGDTVVFQDEVGPALRAAFAGGLDVTAIHNHFFFDEPKVYFMHVHGHGNSEKVASAVKSVWDAIKEVRAVNLQPANNFGGPMIEMGSINSEPLAKIIGVKPEVKDGIVKFTIGREASLHGIRVGGSMGITSWAAFMGKDDLAVVDGDFVMTASEIKPVLSALVAANINIVALHNHMIDEKPSLYFTHFWGKGSASSLAQALKEAMDAGAAASIKN